MSASASEIETIVRLVVEILQAMAVAHAPLDAPKSSVDKPPRATIVTAPSDPTRLVLRKPLVTLEQLSGKVLKDIRVVEVARKAVVTPAVKDELRLRGIQLKRTVASWPVAVREAEILMITSAAKSLRHSRIVAEQIETTPESTTEQALEHLTAPERCVVWCSRTPYAAHQAVCRHGQVRASLLFALSDLERAGSEVNPNVLILDDRRWSLADLNTLVHQWQVEI